MPQYDPIQVWGCGGSWGVHTPASHGLGAPLREWKLLSALGLLLTGRQLQKKLADGAAPDGGKSAPLL